MHLIVLFLVGFILYFLPSILGRNKKAKNSICVVNLFLGWTLVGWVVCLAWALNPDKA